MQKKVIVLFSGGQDSTTCLLQAIKQHGQDNVITVSFDYGQKHISELEQAQKILELFPNVENKLFNISGCLPPSGLTDPSRKVTGPSDYDPKLPASFTPGRNILFFTIAASYAASIGIDEIISGVCQTDYSGYPDCRRIFIDSLEVTLGFGLERNIKITTPLMSLTKAQTWKLAKDLGSVDGWEALEIIRELTMTDYNGDRTRNEWGLGKDDNAASKLKKNGYFEAKEKGWV